MNEEQLKEYLKESLHLAWEKRLGKNYLAVYMNDEKITEINVDDKGKSPEPFGCRMSN